MELKDTEKIAKEIRKMVYCIAHFAGGGHMAGSFSMADMVSVLYFGDVLQYDPKHPDWAGRDKFILSKGHSCYALYAALAMAGFYSLEELKHVGKPGSKFGGHPKIHDNPGVEASTGALGHGLSYAIGSAYADMVDKCSCHTYVMLGDGECQEGSVWEGALSAPTLALENLTVIVDHNKLQAMDSLESIVKMKPFAEKWRAFGWEVLEIDGHDHKAIRDSLLYRKRGKPVCVVANTTKGKGVSFMENVPIWHYRMPNDEELKILMKELDISSEELAL